MREISPMHSHSPRRFLDTLIVIVLIWMFFVQLLQSSLQLSMTSDEPPHMINGYVALTTGDAWTVPAHGHPPLINAWSAWPLLLQPDIPDLSTLRPWGRNFIRFVRLVWPLLGPIERVAFVTRVPIMLLAVVLMALVYRWAREWFGHWGGVLAIAVMAFDPTMLAHSQLNTTDIGMTLFGFACFYLLHRLLRSRDNAWRLVVGIGLLLGAAVAGKGSGVTLAPVVIAMLGLGYLRETGAQWWALWCKRPNPRADARAQTLARSTWQWIGYALLATVIGVLVLWGVYRFEWRALPDTAQPIPLASHIRMLQIIFAEKGRLSFLNGQRQQGGWWWYFPFAFAIKTPIPLIIALGTTLVIAARRGWRLLWDELALWLFPVFYVAAAIQSGLNIGYRHLLPAFPFAYVAIGRLAPWLLRPWASRWRHVVRSVAVALGVWYVAGTIQIHPFALAYFNEFIGGPRNGYHYLVDSNVDWGQQFKALKADMDRLEINQVWLSYYTWIDPAVYGVRYQPLFPAPETEPVMPRQYDPSPGHYAISATTLQGIIMVVPELYDWFRHRQPIAQPGYGLLVYQVLPHTPPARWLAQCIIPAAPLTSEAISEGFGRDDLRQVYFDCTQSWVYPEAGQSSGWYGFFRDTWQQGDAFLREHLAPTRLSFEQVEFRREPAFALFEWNGQPATWPQMQAKSAPSDWPPPRVEAEAALLTTPIRLSGPLTFMGYRVSPPVTKTIELQTFWRVEETSGRPLSLMAHLLKEDGTLIATGDGLGVPVEQWQTGDVIVQRHRFTIPEGTRPGRYWLQTGAYWLDTLERWPVEHAGRTTGDRLLLTSVEIK